MRFEQHRSPIKVCPLLRAAQVRNRPKGWTTGRFASTTALDTNASVWVEGHPALNSPGPRSCSGASFLPRPPPSSTSAVVPASTRSGLPTRATRFISSMRCLFTWKRQPLPHEGRDASFTVQLGDARSLTQDDSSCDAVLMLGPLHHITERDERVRALAEAGRVLRPGGMVAAAAISKFLSLLDGLVSGWLGDPEFDSIVERDLEQGQHRNPTNRPEWFATAFFHHPGELQAEVEDAGLQFEALFGIEGPGWLLWLHTVSYFEPAGGPFMAPVCATVRSWIALVRSRI